MTPEDIPEDRERTFPCEYGVEITKFGDFWKCDTCNFRECDTCNYSDIVPDLLFHSLM